MNFFEKLTFLIRYKIKINKNLLPKWVFFIFQKQFKKKWYRSKFFKVYYFVNKFKRKKVKYCNYPTHPWLHGSALKRYIYRYQFNLCKNSKQHSFNFNTTLNCLMYFNNLNIIKQQINYINDVEVINYLKKYIKQN